VQQVKSKRDYDGKVKVKQVFDLASEIGRFVIPMSDDFGNIHIIVGATKVGYAAVVVISEIAATTARNVSAKTGSLFGAIVTVQFSCSQWGLGPLVTGLQSLLGLAVAVKITLYAGPVVHKVLFVLHSAVVVISGPVGLGFVGPGQLSFSFVDVTTSGFFSIQTVAIVYHLVVEGGIPSVFGGGVSIRIRSA
jgi:hypothetical protein